MSTSPMLGGIIMSANGKRIDASVAVASWNSARNVLKTIIQMEVNASD